MHRRVAGVLLSAPSNPGQKKKKEKENGKTPMEKAKIQRAQYLSTLCVNKLCALSVY